MLQLGTMSQDNECAVILAGGDGTRLKSLTRRIAGDERPKQFCSVLGGATLLEETNFSHRVLALQPERLAVLKVTGVSWNDLGEPSRVMASLAMAGTQPGWVDGYQPQLAQA